MKIIVAIAPCAMSFPHFCLSVPKNVVLILFHNTAFLLFPKHWLELFLEGLSSVNAGYYFTKHD